ncbi:MAG: PIN domain-containing protein [Deltaproteobacteria bacterium]|nr:PIN domain-containing protein [Deltaproteobacteria bacterium]MBN2670096.1 PIN domain-containing protein [Deltaproteobacteria bacterium]
MKVYIDADVVLDVLLGRSDFVNESASILSMSESRGIHGCTTTLTLANIYYILQKINKRKSRRAISHLCDILIILPVSETEITQSLQSDFSDFEDGVQHFCARNHKCDAIITRNQKDFKTSELPVMLPREFLLRGK